MSMPNAAAHDRKIIPRQARTRAAGDDDDFVFRGGAPAVGAALGVPDPIVRGDDRIYAVLQYVTRVLIRYIR